MPVPGAPGSRSYPPGGGGGKVISMGRTGNLRLRAAHESWSGDNAVRQRNRAEPFSVLRQENFLAKMELESRLSVMRVPLVCWP